MSDRPQQPPEQSPAPSVSEQPPSGWAAPGHGSTATPSSQRAAWGAPPPRPTAGTTRTGPLPLYPMTVGDILDGAFKLFKGNLRSMATIVLVFVGPFELLSVFVFRSFLDPELFRQSLEGTETTTGGDPSALWLLSIANVLILPLVTGAIARVVAGSYLGEDVPAGLAIKTALKRSWPLFSSWVLVHLCEAIGVLVAIAVAVLVGAAASSFEAGLGIATLGILIVALPLSLVFMTFFLVVTPAVVAEEIGPIKAMRRSWRLMKPQFWRALGVALLSGFIATMVGSMLSFGPSMAAGLMTAAGIELGWLAAAAGSLMTALITTPIVGIVATLLYFDARIRREGFDLQIMALQLDRPAQS